jgi:hypothetical protein
MRGNGRPRRGAAPADPGTSIGADDLQRNLTPLTARATTRMRRLLLPGSAGVRKNAGRTWWAAPLGGRPAWRPSEFDGHILALDVATLPETLPKSIDPGCRWLARAEKSDPVDPARRLRLGGKRHGEEAQSAGDECSSVHYSMTSSARASTAGGMVIPSALAVFRLITSSNFVGCSTGRSAGLAPLRILSTNAAERRTKSATLGP